MGSKGLNAFAALVVALLVSAGCGESDAVRAEREAELDRLAAAVEDLTEANAELTEAVRRQNRHIATLGRGIATRNEPAAAAGPEAADRADVAGEPGAAAMGGGGLATEEAVEELLGTESGRKAIETAAAAEVAKREAQERRTFVSFAIGRFASEAGLDAHQTDELQRIWKESMDSGAELRRQFAAMRELPEAERPAAREKAMTFMRDIGRTRNERIDALLSEEQLERYQPVEEEIVESLHGAPRRAAPARRD